MAVGQSELTLPKPKTVPKTDEVNLPRRRLLQAAGLTFGFLATSEVVNTILGKKIEGSEPNLPPIEGTLSEYSTGWNAKPWTWVNLAIAKKFLDGKVIKPDETISLVSLLKLDQMDDVPRDNTDPQKGYISAVKIPKLVDSQSFWASGVCLVTTASFRAALKSPLSILEAKTHYSVFPEYFDKDWPRGTDAAVYCPDKNNQSPRVDLILKNQTDKPLVLRVQLTDQVGRPIEAPNHPLSYLENASGYLQYLMHAIRNKLNLNIPKQAFPEFSIQNRKIFLRVAVVSPDQIVDYQTTVGKPKPLPDDPKNSSFQRTLTLADQTITEEFTSQYL